MKSISLQRIQPLTEQLNLGLTAGKVWYDTPTDDYNGLQLAAHLTPEILIPSAARYPGRPSLPISPHHLSSLFSDYIHRINFILQCYIL